MSGIEQTENDFREIERDLELPPDEPHPRPALYEEGMTLECPECGSFDVHDGAEWDFECLGCGHLWAAA